MSRAAALFLCLVIAAPACRKGEDSFASLEKTRKEQSKISRISADAQAPIPHPPSPMSAPTCGVGEIELMEFGGKGSLPAAVVEAALAELAGEYLAGRLGTGEADMKLFVQYALRRSEGGDETLFFGAKGFLKGPAVGGPPSPSVSSSDEPPPSLVGTAPLETVLEADAQQDLAVPEECSDGLAQPACRAVLLEKMVVPAFEQLVRRLSLLCRMEGSCSSALAAMLKSPDPWVRTHAARAAGEQGFTDLADELAGLLDDDELQVVLPVIGTLGRLGAERAVPALVRRAERADESVTRAVAVALADINSPQSRKYLLNWSESHPLTSIRELAGELLGL